MKSKSIARLLAALCLIANLPAASMQKDDPPLLEKSYRLSQKLGGPEQLFYLNELCDVGVHLHPAAASAKEYSQELFERASKVQDNKGLRIAGQKDAVMCMSYIDPAAAMDMLQQVDIDPPGPGDWKYEDHRYNAAAITFINFVASFKGKITPQSVANIIAKARYLGETGQYPYVGVAEVMKLLPLSFANETNALMSDALEFYANETGYYNRDEEFLGLLQALKNTSVSNGLAAHAAATFVQRLTKDPIQFPGDYYAEIHTNPGGKVFPFTDRNQAFLFQAIPEVRRFNPALATQLLQEDPKLAQATDNMGYISGGFIQGNPTTEQATRQHLRWLQQSLVDRIKQCQDSNPQLAANLAQRLTDLSSRITAFSAAIPGIARNNSLQAQVIYEKQLSALGDLPDSLGKVHAMVALAPAAYHVGDSREYQLLATEAFDQSLALSTTGQADRMQNNTGFAELQYLVTFTASQPTDILAAKVNHLPDDWLKAYLWLYEVVGHDKQNAPAETVVTNCSK